MENIVASRMALARTMLQSLDPQSVETRVTTATLRLLLETLIQLGSTPREEQKAGEARRTVMSHLAAVGDAERIARG